MIGSCHCLFWIRSGFFWKAKFSVTSVYLHHSCDEGGHKPREFSYLKNRSEQKKLRHCSNSSILIFAMSSFFPSTNKTSSRSRWQKNQRQRSQCIKQRKQIPRPLPWTTSFMQVWKLPRCMVGTKECPRTVASGKTWLQTGLFRSRSQFFKWWIVLIHWINQYPLDTY